MGVGRFVFLARGSGSGLGVFNGSDCGFVLVLFWFGI